MYYKIRLFVLFILLNLLQTAFSNTNNNMDSTEDSGKKKLFFHSVFLKNSIPYLIRIIFIL